MKPNLYIIRGLPGSGKTTFAKTFNCFHIEADMFYVKKGEYKFDPNYIRKNHKECQEACKKFLQLGCDVVVSNTFTTLKEMKPYLDMSEYADVTVFRSNNSYGSIHNVPEEVITKMKNRFVDFKNETII